jgi:acyl carrier protein
MSLPFVANTASEHNRCPEEFAPIEMDTRSEIQKLISEELDIPVADLDSARSLEELGIDSLGMLEVMFRLEDTFGIKMPDESVSIRTVQDVVDIVERLLLERASAKK